MSDLSRSEPEFASLRHVADRSMKLTTKLALQAVASTVHIGATLLHKAATSTSATVPMAALFAPLADRVAQTAARQSPEAGALAFFAEELGLGAARRAFGIVDGSVQLFVGRPRNLRRTLEQSLEEVRWLADSDELAELLPASPIDTAVREGARETMDHIPERVLHALTDDLSDGSRPRKLFHAVLDDAEQLRSFVVSYPSVLILLAANVGRRLLAGDLEPADIEAFLRGRRALDGTFESRGGA